jgi:hypothetical protein
MAFDQKTYIYGMLIQVENCITNVQKVVATNFYNLDESSKASIKASINKCNMLLNSQPLIQAGGNRNKKLTKKNKNKHKH